MTDDAFVTQPAGVGRARQASARTPLLDQEFDSGTLYALRSAVQAHAGRVGLSEDRADEVVLAVHELAANAIAHGAGHGRLRMWDLAGTLSCEIVDGGPADASAASGPSDTSVPSRVSDASAASRPSAAGEPAAVADPWPFADGHGLWLVRQVADQMDLRSGPRGTRVIVTFALPQPEDH